MPFKYLQNTKTVLCLNGDLPNNRQFFANKFIVATDGAADKLIKMNITPMVIIGDLDSVENSDYHDIEMVHLPDQNQSDFQKALKYMSQRKLLPTVVCGANGGFIDHILHNINVILQNECVFYSPPLIGQVLQGPATMNFSLSFNTKLSLLGMPKAKIRTSGLKWELDDAMLEFPGSNSCFNRTVNENISIEVLEGKLLLLIYSNYIEDMGAL